MATFDRRNQKQNGNCIYRCLAIDLVQWNDDHDFVVSGVFEVFSRDDLKKAIEDYGGKVGSSISAKTNYVIAGANMGPAKLEKANQLKIEIIDEYQFQEMING